jgi:transcriptional regulator with XRE-family HTH domain
MSDSIHETNDPREGDLGQERLGQRIREAREYLGLSQELVADQLGVPRASVSAMETGKRKVSSIELHHLARLFKRPLSYFFDETESIQAQDTGDETLRALFRTTRALSDEDRQQVLKFAQFLRHAGPAPKPRNNSEGNE